jgi:hypothetical protein
VTRVAPVTLVAAIRTAAAEAERWDLAAAGLPDRSDQELVDAGVALGALANRLAALAEEAEATRPDDRELISAARFGERRARHGEAWATLVLHMRQPPTDVAAFGQQTEPETPVRSG